MLTPLLYSELNEWRFVLTCVSWCRRGHPSDSQAARRVPLDTASWWGPGQSVRRVVGTPPCQCPSVSCCRSSSGRIHWMAACTVTWLLVIHYTTLSLHTLHVWKVIRKCWILQQRRMRALLLIQIFLNTFAPEGRIYATVSPIPQTAEKVKTLHMDCG